jgi:hypothetical protein
VGRLRTDSLVTARMNPTASAPRPASWAPTTGVPSGRAEVSATGLPFARCATAEPDAPGDDAGLSAGNRPEALPPGLSLVPVPLRSGKPPGEIDDVDVLALGVGVGVGWPDAVTCTFTDAFGSLTRLAALAVAVSCTDVPEDALAATATPASSCRDDELESTPPTSQDTVPSWLPQPKLKAGDGLAGTADRRTVASGTLPPRAQTLTIHLAVSPGLMLAWERCTLTHRLVRDADAFG